MFPPRAAFFVAAAIVVVGLDISVIAGGVALHRWGLFPVGYLVGAGFGLTLSLVVAVAVGRAHFRLVAASAAQIQALEFDLATARRERETDRLAQARREHDRSAALLSIEAVIKLLDGESSVVDPATRHRLVLATTEELRRLRPSDTEAEGAVKPVDLRELVEPVVAVANAAGAHVCLEMRRGLSVCVTRDVICDVTRNLISNAMHHGGNRNIVVAGRRCSYDFVELSVSDEGGGVHPTHRFDLFEPGAGSGGPGRSGLGLHSARSLLRSCGGDLTLDRSYRGGARFVATIPIGAIRGGPDPHRGRSNPVGEPVMTRAAGAT